LIGLTHAQGQSMAGIARVNVVLPGWIATDDKYVPSEEDHMWHAAGRVGHPNDVAELVAFLADEEKSGFLTCQEFTIDGGVTKRMFYP
jgi:NAD(P)-dependent dehydrogenase (short-subunit alcohol dehydrogenase family)